MKKHVKDFFVRGAMFAWGGPAVLAIVWIVLNKTGYVSEVSVNEAVVSILSTTLMAFIAAGISVVYQIEKLPKAFAALIQMSVLYIDYLGFYLLNGWLPVDKIWLFTVIFIVGFVIVWLIIYISVSLKVKRINEMIGK